MSEMVFKSHTNSAAQTFSNSISNRRCEKCGVTKSANEFAPSTLYLWPNGRVGICYSCVESWLDGNNLNEVDRFCAYAGVAFLPNEWRKIHKREGNKAWRLYFNKFQDINYYKYDWTEQNKKLMELAQQGVVEIELEELKPELIAKLKLIWGDLPELDLIRLERFFNSSLSDYNIETEAQKDLFRKIGRLSILIDDDLKVGIVNKDLIAQYEKLLTSALKTMETIDSHAITSVGQIVEFIERNGYKPVFYEGVARDELDMLEKNIQEYLRDLVQSEVNLTELFEMEKKNRIKGMANPLIDWDENGGEEKEKNEIEDQIWSGGEEDEDFWNDGDDDNDNGDDDNDNDNENIDWLDGGEESNSATRSIYKRLDNSITSTSIPSPQIEEWDDLF